MSTILKLFYRIYLPLFAQRNADIYVDPYHKWYALYLHDVRRWEFKNGDYLNGL